jgi:coenzyme F420-reducing hydrogenase beta subunit
MENSNIIKTRELDLCTSCEICIAVCPKDAVAMEYKFGQFLPKVDDKKCTKCGLCLKLCPGIDIDPLKLRQKKISNHIIDGHFLESYTAYSNNPEIRKNSASGGLITTLIIELIKNKEFDAVFVLDFDKFDDKPARLKATNNINEIINAAKSKYIPASVYNIIKTLDKKDNKKYIIVGTSCQIYGMKKFIKNFNISEKNILFLGLFCEKTLNFNIIRYFEDNKHVDVIEMADNFMAGACTANRGHILNYMRKNDKITLHNGCKVLKFEDGKVITDQKTSKYLPDPYICWTPLLPKNTENPLAKSTGTDAIKKEIATDFVLIGLGYRSENSLYYNALNERVASEIYNLGDSFKPGKVVDAVRSSYALAMEI